MALRQYCIILFISSLFIIVACPRENPLSSAPLLSGSGTSSISRTFLILKTIGIALVVVVGLTIILIWLINWVNNKEIPCHDRAIKALCDSTSWGYLQIDHTVLNFHRLLSDESQMLEKRPSANGLAYRAMSKTGNAFVIKRLNGVIQEKAFFEGHMTRVSDDTFHNVPLQAFFYNEQEKMLVYDYMVMGSLYALLHVRKTALQWKTRWIIALGAARGIARIHKHNLVHGRIKSANIMFGLPYEICVSESSLSDLVAPAQTGPPSQVSDVRDFGVVLLELLSRKDQQNLRQLINRETVVFCLGELLNEQTEVDQHINAFLDLELTRNHAARDQILRLLLLAIDCTDIPVYGHLSMVDVIRRIKNVNLFAGEEFCDPLSEPPEGPADPPGGPAEPPGAPVTPRRSQRLRDRHTPVTPRRSQRLEQQHRE